MTCSKAKHGFWCLAYQTSSCRRDQYGFVFVARRSVADVWACLELLLLRWDGGQDRTATGVMTSWALGVNGF